MSTTAAFAALTQIDLKQLAAGVRESYRNFPLVKVNGHCVRLAVMNGEYRWHRHPGSDECFLVLEGELEIDFVDAPPSCSSPDGFSIFPRGFVIAHALVYAQSIFASRLRRPTRT